MSINIVTQTGNIGNNCQMHQTANSAIASFPLAISSGYGNNQKTSWVTCKLFGKRAEALAQYLLKGVKVAVSGQLSVEEWEKDGVKQSKTVILVSDIDITNFKSEAGSHDEQKSSLEPQVPRAPDQPPQPKVVSTEQYSLEMDEDIPF